MDRIDAVLAACPNITCLSSSIFHTKVEKLPKLHLKALILPSTTFQSQKVLDPFLHAGLEELAIGEVAFQSVLTLLAKKCPKLQVLEMEVPKVNEKSIQQLFDGCVELRDFTLKTHDLDGIIETILQAAGQRRKLQKLYLDMPESAYHTIDSKPAYFADILERHPWLLSLQLGETKCSRLDGGCFDLPVDETSEAAEVEVLTRTCSGATKLHLRVDVISADIQNVLGKRLGTSLQVLRMDFRNCDMEDDDTGGDFSLELGFPLPNLCPNLLRLALLNVNTTDTWLWLCLLAKSCKQLQTIHLRRPPEDDGVISVTDAAMTVLFAECRSLQEFGVDEAEGITHRTLQSMIDCDLHLQVFIWSELGFDQDDIDNFCQTARIKQFLPVPVFIDSFFDVPEF